MMRKSWLSLVALLVLSSATAMASPITTDGTWVVLDQFIPVPGFFTGGPWTWTSANPVKFDITDLFVTSDGPYNVFDFGAPVFSTTPGTEYTTLGVGPFDAPFFTTDPNVAFSDPWFSKGTFLFASGAHSITIENTHTPVRFEDSTVAFRATETAAVPEPATLTLFGLGLGLLARRRRQAS
jgi:hypothetical protein